MIPQIIIKTVDPPSSIFSKKQPKVFEDFLSKDSHLKNEVKEMELKLKSREESYKDLEKQLLQALGLTNIIKNSDILAFLEPFNNNSPNCELQLIETKVENLERQIKEIQDKKLAKVQEIAENQRKLMDFNQRKQEFDAQQQRKASLKATIKEIETETNKLSYFLLDIKRELSPQEQVEFNLNDDMVMLIENLLSKISKTESKISSRRTSIDFIESNFEKIEKLEKELEMTRKNQKKIIREYEDKISKENEADLDEFKAKIKSDLNNLEENYQKQLNLLEDEIKNLENENVQLNEKLEELENLSLEVNKKEKELNSIKTKWDELWSMKADYERDLEEHEIKVSLIPVSKKKPRKSALK